MKIVAVVAMLIYLTAYMYFALRRIGKKTEFLKDKEIKKEDE